MSIPEAPYGRVNKVFAFIEGIVCQRKFDEAKTNNVGKEIRKLSTIRSDHSSWQRGDQEKVHFKHNLSQSSQQQSTNIDGKQGLCARY